MDPICFRIGSHAIYWYGVMMALAFLISLLHLNLLGKKEGRPSAQISDLLFWIMIGAIMGARFAYVIANWHEFADAPGMILRLDQGGLVYYGGFMGGLLGSMLFALVKRESILALWDFIATALPLGHALGRVGCFLNGCCYGSACNLPWAHYSHGMLRHPVQLYETTFNLALFAFLNFYYARRQHAGRTCALYLIFYPLGRFLLEFLRGDERLPVFGLNLAQITSLALIFLGCSLWLHTARHSIRPHFSHQRQSQKKI